MPPKGKRTAANHHDKRHENGLAAPGKRIHKQRSNSNLNGHANGKARSNSLALPTSDLNQELIIPNGSAHGPLPYQSMAGASSGGCVDGRERTSSEASMEDSVANLYKSSNGSVDPAVQISQPRPELQEIRKHASYKMPNPLSMAVTILSSCPLQDVIAMLIILLQLPPTILAMIHFLFACLTFVPSNASQTSTISTFTAFSVNDMFQSTGGVPTLGTIILVDIIALILWATIPVTCQIIVLDLAQAVIAISLGGAAAAKGGIANSVLVCVSLILFSHLFRFRTVRQYGLQLLWTLSSKAGFRFFHRPPLASPDDHDVLVPKSWARILMAVHIVTQGIVRLIRRSLRRDVSQINPTKKRADPEAAGASLKPSNVDSGTDIASSSSTDGRAPGPSPAARDTKDKSAKRKRRHANHVRSQQPFWAAVANTKVSLLKEMEQNLAVVDSTEANSRDIRHIGNANVCVGESRVWILEVGSTDICFQLDLYRGDSDFLGAQELDPGSRPGIDTTKPFFVRVNKANWSSIRIREAGELEIGGRERWTGEIYGLAPHSNYYCEFVRALNDQVIYATSIITHPAPATEQASVTSSQPHQPLRPASPTTTLKQSIAAAEQQLQDLKNRSKRNRKDHKTALTAIKKELDNLKHRLETAGGSDDRQKGRALQFNQNIRQAEEASAAVQSQINSLGDISEDEQRQYHEKKRSWQREKAVRAAVFGELNRSKSGAEGQIHRMETEINSARTKRDRLQARLKKLNEQLESLRSQHAQDQDVRTKRQNSLAVQAAQREQMQAQYDGFIGQYEHKAQEYQAQYMLALQELQQLEALERHPIPATPEGPLPGTSRPQHSSLNNAFQFPPIGSLAGTPQSLFTEPLGGRGRSGSMLSGASGFTDELEDASPVPPMFGPLNNGYVFPGPVQPKRAGSQDSGSGSGSGSGRASGAGSQRDPMSPIGSAAVIVQMSPASR